MKLNINKAAQGPVLAKSDEPREPDTNYCGTGDINGSTGVGCGRVTDNGDTIFVGVTRTNGGSVGVQYSGTIKCC
ncbi:hypothetical protein [Massilia sp. TSP1-1-2]|uniref:hypothetical protein n=1 Tax=Massilia sp. TSP1-1-2 TaxID=2804649 RepID=UPI003CE9B956